MSVLQVNTINEVTSANGVTIDGLSLKDGNVVPANGKGIDFSAASGSASGSSNALLDDYEEGTWTISTSNGSNSWTVSNATYTKVGNIVTCGAYINTITKSVSSAALTMSLPFTSKSDQRAVGSIMHGDFNYSGTTPSLVVYVGGNATSASIFRVQDDGTYELQTHAITNSSSLFFFSITYRV